MQFKWISRYSDEISLPADLADIAERLDLSEFLAALLYKRGFTTNAEMADFLNPSLMNLLPLETWPGLEEASSIIAKAALNNDLIAVWGDYDVDGITAAALVTDFFKMHGIKIRPHIPNRLEDGYGLNKDDIKTLADDGVKLILTVDCGISDNSEIQYAKDLGLTVIVSDHHLPAYPLPPADVICAPTIDGCVYPYLAGVGVAFMLVAAINKQLDLAGKEKVDIRSLLDLVALGTLADVCKMTGQNRILVKNGLLKVAEANRPGIAALKTVSHFAPSANLGSGQVVFSLTPRINAAGRMGESRTALKLLLTEDKQEAGVLAQELNALNETRKQEENSILEEAKEMAKKLVNKGFMGLVLYAPHWHMGVIGIVASRIVEEFHRPTLVLCDTGKVIKGSGRSISGFDLHAALTQCSDLFLNFGGHKMAAGMSLSYKNINKFKSEFNRISQKELGETLPTPNLKTDGVLSFSQATDLTLLKEIELMQPFGVENPEPVFISPPLIIKNIQVRSILTLVDVTDPESGITLKAKIWRPKTPINPRYVGQKILLAYSPRIDYYNGAATVDIRVKDWVITDSFGM